MDIRILQLLDGANKAQGLTVVIDVFRAFSTACFLADQGAKEIISVGNIEIAYMLKEKNPGFVLLGERNEVIPPGFDYGNSPTHIKGIDFTGKTIVHTTSSGTQGLVHAKGASELLTGSFVNAPAIARYIINNNPDIVSLVCMGYATLYSTEEDTFCAEYIKNTILDIPTDIKTMLDVIKNSSGKRLFEPQNQAHSPESDFYLCTDLGRFDFVLKAHLCDDGLIRLKEFCAKIRESKYSIEFRHNFIIFEFISLKVNHKAQHKHAKMRLTIEIINNHEKFLFIHKRYIFMQLR